MEAYQVRSHPILAYSRPRYRSSRSPTLVRFLVRRLRTAHHNGPCTTCSSREPSCMSMNQRYAECALLLPLARSPPGCNRLNTPTTRHSHRIHARSCISTPSRSSPSMPRRRRSMRFKYPHPPRPACMPPIRSMRYAPWSSTHTGSISITNIGSPLDRRVDHASIAPMRTTNSHSSHDA